MSSHHSEQMSQRSQVSRIALRRCSQNVFVFVFVFVNFFVMSCLFITLIKCLKGHKSLGSLCYVKSKSTVTDWVSDWVTRSPIELFWTAKNRWVGLLLNCAISQSLKLWSVPSPGWAGSKMADHLSPACSRHQHYQLDTFYSIESIGTESIKLVGDTFDIYLLMFSLIA